MTKAHRDLIILSKLKRNEQISKSALRTGHVEIPRRSRADRSWFGERQVKLTNLDKLFWPELKNSEARLAPVLRRCFDGAAAAP